MPSWPTGGRPELVARDPPQGARQPQGVLRLGGRRRPLRVGTDRRGRHLRPASTRTRAAEVAAGVGAADGGLPRLAPSCGPGSGHSGRSAVVDRAARRGSPGPDGRDDAAARAVALDTGLVAGVPSGGPVVGAVFLPVGRTHEVGGGVAGDSPGPRDPGAGAAQAGTGQGAQGGADGRGRPCPARPQAGRLRGLEAGRDRVPAHPPRLRQTRSSSSARAATTGGSRCTRTWRSSFAPSSPAGGPAGTGRGGRATT